MEHFVPWETLIMSLPNQLFRAGAGAGKTSTLIRTIEERALAFKAEHGSFPHFIVTTFTRKATQEIRERLLSRALESKDPAFLEFANSSQQILISTIHGILNTFLNRYGHKFELDPSLKIIDLRQERKLEYSVIKEMMKKNTEVAEVAEVFGLKRLVQILHETVLKLQQYGTLNPFSFEELQEAFGHKIALLEIEARDLSSRVSSETDEANWQKYVVGLSAAVSALKAQKNSEALDILGSQRKPSFTAKSKISAITDGIAKELKADLQDLAESNSYSADLWKRHLLLTKSFLNVAGEFGSKIAELKRKRGMISMSDLELRTLEALRADPAAAEGFSQEWDYWFIDEYQDTSPVQEEILTQLKGDRPCFVVGDPQQSIYLFRGARTEVFLRKEKEFEEQDFEISRLENNFRSREELVLFFNQYFHKLGRGFLPMTPQKQAKTALAPVTFLRAESQDSELQSISNWIKGLVSQGVALEDVCVLTKTNDIASNVAAVLKKDGVPFRLHSSGGFARRREIVDALVLLKFIVNPHDSLNLLSLLRSPYFFTEDSRLEKLRSEGKDLWVQIIKDGQFKSLEQVRDLADKKGIFAAFTEVLQESGYFEAANLTDETGVREANLFKLIASLRESMAKANFNFLTFIDDTLSDSAVMSESDALPALEPKRVNIMTIHASKGLQFAHVIIPGFSKGKKKTNRENVIAIEETKKIVLAIPNEEASQEIIFPGLEAVEKFYAREIEESHRLLYVAFTRAIETLFVSSQGKAEKNSWLEGCPLDLEIGAHEGYQVLETVEAQELAANPNLKNALEKVQIPPAANSKKVSVTSLLFKPEEVRKIKIDVGISLGRLRTGVELHNIFEKMTLSGLRDIKVPEEFQSAVNYVLQNKEIPFQEIAVTGKAEYGIIYLFGGYRLEGKIDLWGIANGELWIVDYKTGSIKNREKAFQQLRIYALPLMEWLEIKKAKLAVIYPLEEKCFVESVEYGNELKKNLSQLLPAHLSAAGGSAGLVREFQNQPEADI
jgi:ATP-dependent helicase/nuclease subunit A